MGKIADSRFFSSIVGTVFCWVLAIFGLITKKENSFVFSAFIVGVLSFAYFIYLLNKTKDDVNERYDDERKNFVSEKSRSKSFDILFAVTVIFEILVQSGKVKISADSALIIIIGSALIIQFISYLFYKSKY